MNYQMFYVTKSRIVFYIMTCLYQKKTMSEIIQKDLDILHYKNIYITMFTSCFNIFQENNIYHSILYLETLEIF